GRPRCQKHTYRTRNPDTSRPTFGVVGEGDGSTKGPPCTRRHRAPNARTAEAGNEKRVVKACITAGFHVLRFSHQNGRIPSVHRCPSGLSRPRCCDAWKGAVGFLARTWSPRILPSLFALDGSVGQHSAAPSIEGSPIPQRGTCAALHEVIHPLAPLFLRASEQRT
ncbi:unnamed protein product, partial [Musa textilis]